MTGRVDVVALVVGLILLAWAGLGLWLAFGSVDWALLGVALPALLVVLGLLGLLLSRRTP